MPARRTDDVASATWLAKSIAFLASTGAIPRDSLHGCCCIKISKMPNPALGLMPAAAPDYSVCSPTPAVDSRLLSP